MSPAHKFFYQCLIYRSGEFGMSKMKRLKIARRYSIVLSGISRGHSIMEIAKEWRFNKRTIELDVARMQTIMVAKNITHLVAIAIRTKLIK